MNYSLCASLLEVTMFSCLTVAWNKMEIKLRVLPIRKGDGLQKKEGSSDVTIHFLYG